MKATVRKHVTESTSVGEAPAKDAKGKTIAAKFDYPTVHGVKMIPGADTEMLVIYDRDEEEPGYAKEPVTFAKMKLTGYARKSNVLTFSYDRLKQGEMPTFDVEADDEVGRFVFPVTDEGRKMALERAREESQETALRMARDKFHRAGLVLGALTKDDDKAIEAWIHAKNKEHMQMIGALGATPFKALAGTAGNPAAAEKAFMRERKIARKERGEELTKAYNDAVKMRKELLADFGEEVKLSNDEADELAAAAAKAEREAARAAKKEGRSPKAVLKALLKRKGITKDDLAKLLAEASSEVEESGEE